MRSEKHGTVFDKNRMLCQCFLYIFSDLREESDNNWKM